MRNSVSTAPFDGYPYLVTRIGHSGLRHVAVLPSELDRERLTAMAVRQAAANRLDTAVVFAPGDVVFAYREGSVAPSDHVPTGIPICEKLVVPLDAPGTAELEARHARLRRFVQGCRATGYVVGDHLEGGRPATPDEVARLIVPKPDGLPGGLAPCRECGAARGEALRPLPNGGRDVADPTSDREVVVVPCLCENLNRCAGCGGPLAGRALSAWSWFEERRGLWYVAAYCGLGHRCPSAGGDAGEGDRAGSAAAATGATR